MRKQRNSEEIANSITHGTGVLLSTAALSIMVVFASLQGDAWKVVSFSIYGATLVILYLASTLYHLIKNEKVKAIFQIIDHSSINLLIAGTYTPVTLVTLRGPWGWTLFGLIWGMAIFSIYTDVFWKEKKGLNLSLYVAMGWLAIVAVKPLLDTASGALLLWMVLGGLCYTFGIIFYLWKSLKFHHMIWHLFVLAGSISHFIGIFFYLDPLPGV
jgi:hemolysin III